MATVPTAPANALGFGIVRLPTGRQPGLPRFVSLHLIIGATAAPDAGSRPELRVGPAASLFATGGCRPRGQCRGQCRGQRLHNRWFGWNCFKWSVTGSSGSTTWFRFITCNSSHKTCYHHIINNNNRSQCIQRLLENQKIWLTAIFLRFWDLIHSSWEWAECSNLHSKK